MTASVPIYGIVAEFDDPGPLVEAARASHEKGYRKMEAYTPYPVRELDEVLHDKRNLPLICLVGGILGFLTAWGMEYYIAVIDYPTNIGGRPLNSWPSFIVIMFELTILFAANFAFWGMLALCGLPMPHHPMFNLKDFADASKDHFFLAIEARDPLFQAEDVTRLLEGFEPLQVWEVDDD
jgi:ActD protein